MAAGHDPGGKLNLYDVLTLASAGGGAVLGYHLGHDAAGTTAGILGALLGPLLGFLLLRFAANYQLTRFVHRLKGTDTPTLRERLKSEYYISHLLVGILLSRGEPEAELRDYTLHLLLSSSADQRWNGWRTLNLCFPETAEALAGIKLLTPGPADGARITALIAVSAHMPAPAN